ncbi:type I restriction-modification system subunit M N-terminal domain-containing protein [Membranicola marinus]|uniref:Type I restriction-modification system subunit M N-terminal domain-containing protein n=1 Tax=Membranihabitans marinus TaxID=1227546 RepID=A0A953HZN7_9BACT|nr:type I restriction-modification system subunit M N-terminal domain-containing protein [Membranihabitans marinus]MBY5958637.1 type I restriction-modification system subunit M N-terminal domain-containing protein [Membranihabitans marinus]
MSDSSIISKIWNLTNVLRDDGVGYGDYLEQITYLLILKMADELNWIFRTKLCHLFRNNCANIMILTMTNFGSNRATL